MKGTTITHEFVELMPAVLNVRTLYISIPYATAIHLCACGCGIKVVTPISPPEWHLTWDGDTVSLYPSVGNWQFPCQSHYWIRRNRIVWAGDMTKQEIAAARRQDSQQLDAYFGTGRIDDAKPPVEPDGGTTFVTRLRKRFRLG